MSEFEYFWKDEAQVRLTHQVHANWLAGKASPFAVIGAPACTAARSKQIILNGL